MRRGALVYVSKRGRGIDGVAVLGALFMYLSLFLPQASTFGEPDCRPSGATSLDLARLFGFMHRERPFASNLVLSLLHALHSLHKQLHLRHPRPTLSPNIKSLLHILITHNTDIITFIHILQLHNSTRQTHTARAT